MTVQRIAGHDPITTNVTFAREIRAILSAHCTICHAPGGPAPAPLVTYEEVLPWARAIKEQTLTRRMPIWHAARGYGMFTNDPTLSPFELQLIVSWVDGGRPAGAKGPTGAGAPGTGLSTVARSAKVDAGLVVGGRSGWITGWTFTPGDPLIASATFTSADGAPIGTWVAGDRPVRLPLGSAIRVLAPVRIDVRRRKTTDLDQAGTTRPYRLNLARLSEKPKDAGSWPERRVWTEMVACGGTLGPADASIVAARPILNAGASAQIAVERLGGSSPTLLGWFRDFDPDYARIYWLARPIDFAAAARIASDAPCRLEVMLSARR